MCSARRRKWTSKGEINGHFVHVALISLFAPFSGSPLGLSDKDMQLQYDKFPENPKPADSPDLEEEEVDELENAKE